MAERFVVPVKPGNAGGGKGPQFKTDAIRGEDMEIGQPINSEVSPKDGWMLLLVAIALAFIFVAVCWPPAPA